MGIMDWVPCVESNSNEDNDDKDYPLSSPTLLSDFPRFPNAPARALYMEKQFWKIAKLLYCSNGNNNNNIMKMKNSGVFLIEWSH